MNDSSNGTIRRLTYRSVSTSTDAERSRDHIEIRDQSRLNNGLEALSGVLLIKDDRYLQVLEGTPECVAHIFDRIRGDSRHVDVEVLEDEIVPRRMFGEWDMGSLDAGEKVKVERSIRRYITCVPEDVRRAVTDML